MELKRTIASLDVRATMDSGSDSTKPATSSEQGESPVEGGQQSEDQISEEKSPEEIEADERKKRERAIEDEAYRRGVDAGRRSGYDEGYNSGSSYFPLLLLLLIDFGG